MLFRDLYKHVSTQASPPVSFDSLTQIVRVYHAGVGSVKIFAVKYPVPLRQAYYHMIDIDRSSAYEEEFGDVEIAYCDELDRDPIERRYALTKELMHVFDGASARIDTREKFIALLREIQNQPLQAHESDAFKSELDTRWMAAIILCPKHLRDTRVKAYRDGSIQDFDIASEFRIPEWIVPFVMDDYYDLAFETLVGTSLPSSA